MNKFHTLGTKHETYVKRFIKKYSNNKEITFNEISEKKIDIFGDNEEKKIDVFTSIATYKQFFLVCEALGFVNKGNSSYKVLNIKWNFENVTNYIFKLSNDDKIFIYRNSRKICFLYLLGFLSEANIEKWDIVDKKRKKRFKKLKNLKNESSWWEKEAIRSWQNIRNVIERIKNEYPISNI